MPPAARLTDSTVHGSPLAPGTGSANVLIGGLPAWRAMIDQHACPAVSISGADGVGSVLKGSTGVFINSQMACRTGDIVVEKPGLAMGPANPIAMGCQNVMIGDQGGGMPPGFGSAHLLDAMVKASQDPIPDPTPQSGALAEAAQEGVPLVESCPHAKHG